MRVRALLLAAACCALFASPASAEVRVTFANGRVTVIANAATVSEILAEWSRVGGSTFVDANRIPAQERLTIRLENATELDALDVLLRSVAGYMIMPRQVGAAGSSLVGRVFILPTSTPAAYVAPAEVPQPGEDPDLQSLLSAAPPRPDDDGPVRFETPPPPPSASSASPQFGQASPLLGQSSPLGDGTTTQTVPGLGVVTSQQPGVVITGQAAPGRPNRPSTRPTQPKPGGGGRR
jgi:hypothetical protein